MTLVTRSSAASIDTSTSMFAPQLSGDLYAGEALDALAACYIKASDGKVYMSNGTAANEAAKFDGFTARACALDEPVTLYGLGMRARYGSGLTIGQDLYVAATAGRLDTAPTVGGVKPIARVIDGTDIRVIRNAEEANSVAGVAGGYKVARGQHTTIDADDTIVTGLASVVSVVASLESDPVIGCDRATAVLGDQAGAPAAGSVQIKTWKPTAVDDATPIAATTFTKKVNWIAIGT